MRKVALVHEFLTQLGGAERVLMALHELFPDAPVYTLVYDKEKTQGVFENLSIRPSFLQNVPGARVHYKWFLPLMPTAIESFDFSDYDLILSDSSAFAKGIITPKSAIHICYCHTPTRYLWQDLDSYVATARMPKLLCRPTRYYLEHILRRWDFSAAQRPDLLIANSKTVQARIRKYYNRESIVIYPPVDTKFFYSIEPKQDYFLTGSRLEPYKKIEVVVEAFSKLGLSLKVVGSGSQIEVLKKRASPNVEFLGRVSDEKLRALYSGALAFVFPALEDAGIMVLESLACGTPIIGLQDGGTAEFVSEGKNGILFKQQTVEDVMDAIKKFGNLRFETQTLRDLTLQFSKESFKNNLTSLIQKYAHRS